MAELTAAAITEVEPPRTRRQILGTLALVYGSARILTFAYLFIASAIAQPGSRFGPGIGIDRFLNGWDGQWYWTIAYSGYPVDLPLNASGQVAENAWAFMPLYPWLANLVGMPFGSWPTGAALLTFISGFIATCALYRLLRNRVSHTVALWAVVFFANGPLGAMFHVDYAESLFLVFLFLGLDCLLRRRFAWLWALIPLMGFTRPGVLAFSLTLGLYGIFRWLHRRTDPLPPVHIVQIISLGLWAAAIGFAWQAIVGVVTGDMSAYLETELSWRRNWLPGAAPSFIPFEGWILGLNFWFGQWQIPIWLGWTVTLAGVLGLGWVFVRAPGFRALGPELRLWIFSYTLYIVAVFFPQSSTLRLFLPLAPAWGAAAYPPSRTWRVSVLVGCVIYQWLWIYNMYAIGTDITQIP